VRPNHPEGFWHIEPGMRLAPSKPARYITMTRQQPKFEVQDLVQLLADIRAPHIANEISGQAFKPQAHPLYIEYSLELLRQLLPVAALEKSYTGATFNHRHDTPDHLVCNRTVRMMLKLLDDAFYERFKAEHPRMPKQLTVQEWGGFMLLLRSHDWHNGVPVYPSAGFGVDTSIPLDFITEEQCAMARAARLGIALLDHDPFDFAREIKGYYPNTSLSALVLVVTKAQSKQRVSQIVDTARGPAGAFVYHATIEQAEQGVDTAAEQWGWTLTHGERECAIQGLHLAPPASPL